MIFRDTWSQFWRIVCDFSVWSFEPLEQEGIDDAWPELQGPALSKPIEVLRITGY